MDNSFEEKFFKNPHAECAVDSSLYCGTEMLTPFLTDIIRQFLYKRLCYGDVITWHHGR